MKNIMCIQYCVLVAVLLMAFPALTQSDWTVVENCILQIPVPEDSSYNGTILLRGYGGIHGVNAKWDTPRVVARAPARPYAIALSPNGLWYATLEGHTAYSETNNHAFCINAIVTYSTLDNNEVFRLDWYNHWLNNWGYRRMYWYDNHQLLYETGDDSTNGHTRMLIDPFMGKTSEWVGEHDILRDWGGAWYDWVPIQFPSPDFERVVSRRQGVVNSITGDIIAELKPALQSFSPYVAWHPDGTEFIAEVGEERQTSLALFSRDGEFIEVIFDLKETRLSQYSIIQWSPDGHYIAFATREQELFIVDTDTKQITETCLDIGEGLAWSPDGTQLVFLEQGQ